MIKQKEHNDVIVIIVIKTVYTTFLRLFNIFIDLNLLVQITFLVYIDI